MTRRNGRLSDLPTIPMAKSADGLIKEARARSAGAMVFLSHSHLDKARLAQVIQLLTEHGATVYVDELDPATNLVRREDIAHLLRQRIVACTRLVAVASTNLSSSRWIPWELGYGDGTKGLKTLALLPLDPSSLQTASIEQEYLSTYSTIALEEDRGVIPAKAEWRVFDPTSATSVPLRDWLGSQVFVIRR